MGCRSVFRRLDLADYTPIRFAALAAAEMGGAVRPPAYDASQWSLKRTRISRLSPRWVSRAGVNRRGY
jgi:hypothetical protein